MIAKEILKSTKGNSNRNLLDDNVYQNTSEKKTGDVAASGLDDIKTFCYSSTGSTFSSCFSSFLLSSRKFFRSLPYLDFWTCGVIEL